MIAREEIGMSLEIKMNENDITLVGMAGASGKENERVNGKCIRGKNVEREEKKRRKVKGRRVEQEIYNKEKKMKGGRGRRMGHSLF